MSQRYQAEPLFDLPEPNSVGAQFGAVTAPERGEFADVDLLDRMRVLRDTGGFLPTSRGEINEGFTLLSYLHEPGATARHLNEVLQHQQKPGVKTEDPGAAVRSITREYAGYAGRARTDRFNLLSLRDELAGYDGNGLRALGGVGIVAGLPQFVRYVDLSRLAESGKVPVEPFAARSDKRRSALDPYTMVEPTTEMRQHMRDTLKRFRIWDAKHMVDAVVGDQQKRLDFWTQRLREARAHSLARPIATEALKGLGVLVEK